MDAASLVPLAWGEIEFAIVIVALGLLLLLREIINTVKSENTRLKKVVNIVIIPLFVLFIFNLVVTFL